jgi:hypothetical protein
VLVRVSYFPNWNVDGAEGPYRIAPNFMVVVPTENEVRLSYGRSGSDLFYYALTLVGIGLLVFFRRRGDAVFDAAGEAAGAAAVPNRDFTSQRRGPTHDGGGVPTPAGTSSPPPVPYAGADDEFDDEFDDGVDPPTDAPPPVTEAPRNLPPVDAESAPPRRAPPLA